MEQQIDVFHCTDYRIPRLKNTPVVATLHDAIMLKNPELASNFRKLKNHILKRSALAAKHIITVSHTMIEDIVDHWGIKPEKISAVYNGIDNIWYKTLEPNVLQNVLSKHAITKPFILTVGTLQPRKNILRLVQAFKNLPKNIRSEHQLVVVGKKGWDCDDIIQALQQLENNNEGKWLQYVDFEELRALYQAAALFAFPSLAEGFGFPVIESFASKTAVLASNTSSIPEIAGNAAYLVNPESIDELSHGLKSLLEDESLRHDYIQKGLVRSQNFSWKKCAEETYKILSQVS
jgi:alpha-1,3-rhamnosyl/mannosyltransferase